MPELKERFLKNRRGLCRLAFAAAACAAALALTGAALGHTAGAKEQAPEEKVYRVATIQAAPTGNDVYLQYTGLIQPAATEQCTFGTMGTVQTVYVKEGDQVREGQVLAELDTGEVERQVSALKEVADQTDRAAEIARGARDEAQKDYDKACEEASSSDIEAAKSALAAAQANRDAKLAELGGYSAQAAADQQAWAAASQGAQQAQAVLAAAQEKLAAAQQARDELGADATEAQKQAAEQAVTKAQSEVDAAALAQGTAQAALADATEKLAASQQLAVNAQTQLTALETGVGTCQAVYDALKGQGGDSSAAKGQKQRLDAAESALATAKGGQATARSGYESALAALEECQLKAGSDGYVVKVAGGEGSPYTSFAVVLGSRDVVARFGASQSDVRSLAVGQSAAVTAEGQEYTGVVKSIAVLPDETTRTYTVDVEIGGDAGDFYLGEMAAVKIGVGERTGTWLPLAVVMNDGEDYVYLVENGRAVRRTVTLLEVSDDMVLVSGLENGGQVISEGMKTVRSGSAVSVG